MTSYQIDLTYCFPTNILNIPIALNLAIGGKVECVTYISE